MFEILVLVQFIALVLVVAFFGFLLGRLQKVEEQLRQVRGTLYRFMDEVDAKSVHELNRHAESKDHVASEKEVAPVPGLSNISQVAPPVPVPASTKASRTASPEELERAVATLETLRSPARGNEPRAAAAPWPPETIREFEQRAGQRWMTWVGAIALLIGVLFLIKYCFDHGWIGPEMRLAVGMITGLLLMVGGEWAVRQRYLPFAQGLLAAGLSICHASLFAAYRFHDLIPQPVAFSGMVILTIVGMSLAVFHDFLAFAVLAVFGGFLAPLLLSTGKDGRDMLFAYVLLLDLGVLCSLFGRKWRWIDGVAFLWTVALYMLWYDEYYRPEGLAPAIAWLSVLYLLFVFMPMFPFGRNGGPMPPERLGLIVANAAFGLGVASLLLHENHGSALAGVALAMAVLYALIGWRTQVRFPDEYQFLLTMTALSVALVTIAIPIYFEMDTVTVLWAAEAPLLAYLGYLYGYAPLRRMAAAVLVLSVYLGFPQLDRILHAPDFTPFLHREYWTAIAVPVGALLLAWIHDRFSDRQDEWDRLASPAATIIGGIGLLVVTQVDVTVYLDRQGLLGEQEFWTLKRDAFTVILWSMGAVLFEVAGSIKQSRAARSTGVLIAAVVGVGTMFWMFDPTVLRLVPVFNAKFSAVAFAGGVLLVTAWLRQRDPGISRSDSERAASLFLTVEALVLFWILCSAEAYFHFLSRLGHNPQGYRAALSSLSVVWALYATLLLALGFAKRVRWLRLTGLALFGLTACKLIVLDLAGLRDLARVASFFALGALMIASSYLYHRLEKRLDAPSTTHR